MPDTKESRKYRALTVEAMEKVFLAVRDDVGELKDLLHELEFRKTPISRDLKARIEVALVAANKRSRPATKNSLKSGSATWAPPEPAVVATEDDQNFPVNWDPEQRVVFEGNEDTCMLIESGPGSGKTAVACKRVAWLVEECDLEPTKILLVSFTRAAVKELQNRIESHASKPGSVTGVRIVTLDSFSWQVITGLCEVETGRKSESYEENIDEFTKLLKEKDRGVREFLGELEHVIIDEAQDLVSARADLVIQLIKSLPKQCGVTVFGDSAQAIYGFTSDSEVTAGHPSATVMDIVKGELSGFGEINLENNHRTGDVKLRELSVEGRKKLFRLEEGSPDSWKEMVGLIKKNSHGEANDDNLHEIRGRSDALVLYRSRAEAIMASSILWSAGIENKLRMSRIPPRISPWIGRVFGMLRDDTVREDDFMALWTSRVSAEASGAEAAWKLLKRYAWEQGGIVRLAKLRSVLGRSRPPLDFLVDERDLRGPIVGTIHASKGREAEVVRLMLPSHSYVDRAMSAAVLAEEERVLFVGATRARKRLLVGSGMRTYSQRLQSGRVYRKTRTGGPRRQVEIGLQGDVSGSRMVSAPITAAEAEEIQDWLWENRSSTMELESRYDHQCKLSFLHSGSGPDAMRVGGVGAALGQELFAIAREVGCSCPGGTIRNVRMVGVSTVVIGEADRDSAHQPWKGSAFVLVPVITGFPMVYFNR